MAENRSIGNQKYTPKDLLFDALELVGYVCVCVCSQNLHSFQQYNKAIFQTWVSKN